MTSALPSLSPWLPPETGETRLGGRDLVVSPQVHRWQHHLAQRAGALDSTAALSSLGN